MRVVLCVLGCAVLLLSSSAQAQPPWCWNNDHVYARVNGSTVSVFHYGAAYNCGLATFDYFISYSGSTIRVSESPVINGIERCYCCFNASIDIENVPAGRHLIDVSWDDDDPSEGHAMLEVEVPDNGQAGTPVLGNRTLTPCLPQDPGGTGPTGGTRR